MLVFSADRTTDLPTVTVGKGEVEREQVIRRVGGDLESLGRRVGGVDGVTLPSKRPGDGVGQLDLVVDDQDSHLSQPRT